LRGDEIPRLEVKLGLVDMYLRICMQKTFKDAIIDAWDAFIPMVLLNLMWFLLTLLVITAFPATGALYYATNRLVHGETPDISTFLDGFKGQFWTSWKWGFLNLFVFFILVLNIWFYGQFEGWGFLVLQSIFISITMIYSCMALFIYPFLLEQDEPTLKVAVRNSFAVFVRFMGRSIGLLVLFVLLSVVSTLLPPLWFIITISLMAYLGNWQTIEFIGKLSNDGLKDKKTIDQTFSDKSS
jgi:uncharacterized membrane protein YesL